MYSAWKIVLPVVALAVVVGAVAMYKNNSTAPATENAQTDQGSVLGEKRIYDLNSPPITDADIYAAVKIANTESPAENEEEKDSAAVTSDNEALNNFNNASYASTNF